MREKTTANARKPVKTKENETWREKTRHSERKQEKTRKRNTPRKREKRRENKKKRKDEACRLKMRSEQQSVRRHLVLHTTSFKTARVVAFAVNRGLGLSVRSYYYPKFSVIDANDYVLLLAHPFISLPFQGSSGSSSSLLTLACI